MARRRMAAWQLVVDRVIMLRPSAPKPCAKWRLFPMKPAAQDLLMGAA